MSRFYVHVYLHVYSLSLLFDCLLFAGCWCSQFWESLDCLCVCVHVLHLFLQLYYWCVAAYVCVCVWFLGEIVFFFNLGFCVCVSSIHNNSTCIRAIHRETEILHTIDIQQRVFQWNSWKRGADLICIPICILYTIATYIYVSRDSNTQYFELFLFWLSYNQHIRAKSRVFSTHSHGSIFSFARTQARLRYLCVHVRIHWTCVSISSEWDESNKMLIPIFSSSSQFSFRSTCWTLRMFTYK